MLVNIKMPTSINQVGNRTTTWNAAAASPAGDGPMLAQPSINVEGGFQRPHVDTATSKPRLAASRIRNLGELASARPGAYTQRKTLASTPGLTQNPLLSLSHQCYNLPERLVGNLASLGINLIYPWQSSCLLGHGILSGEKNLVYTAPTGGGKSLVADILMLKERLSGRRPFWCSLTSRLSRKS